MSSERGFIRAERRATRIVGGKAQAIVVGLRRQAQRKRLGKTATGQRAADAAHPLFAGRQPHGLDGEGREFDGKTVVADETRDLLDEIDVDRDVGAPAGNAPGRDGIRLRDLRASDAREESFDLGLGDVGAQERLRAIATQLHLGGGVGMLRHADVHRRVGRAAADLEDELRRVVGDGARGERIDAAFEAIGAVGRSLGAAREEAHRGGLEESGFEEDGFGGVADAGRGAAHHAAQALGCAIVADHEIAGRERQFPSIEEFERLAGASAADVHGGPREACHVEGVQRLAGLEHDEVRDVDQRRDGTQSHGAQERLHPVGRRTVLHAADGTSHIAGATATGFHGDGNGRGLRRFGQDGRFQWAAQRAPQAQREFACKADVSGGVGTVGRHVDFKDNVREAQCLGK